MSNQSKPSQVKTDNMMGRSVGAGLFNGAVIGSGIGLALGLALQAIGILDSLSGLQMGLFVAETAMGGAVIGAIWKGVTTRDKID